MTPPIYVLTLDSVGRCAGLKIHPEQQMQAKVGDTVHVKARVTKVHPSGDVLITLLHSDDCATAGALDIIHVEPRPLQVGDKVIRKRICALAENGAANAVGGILHVMDEYAWVFWRHRPVTVPLADLVRA